MAVPKDKPTDTVDIRFFVDGPQEVDLPHIRWLFHNHGSLPRKMPLTAFLKRLPFWLLRDVQLSWTKLESATKAQSRAALAESSSCLALTCKILALWSDEPDGSTGKSLDELAECVAAFGAACALEHNRRCGLLRIHVSGEDRLDRPESWSIQTNPVVLAELGRLNVPPDPSNPDFQALMAKVTPIAMKSDWAEPERLTEDG